MAAKKRRRRVRREPAGAAASLSEARVTEYLTSGWLLTVLTTLVCEVGGALALWWGRSQQLQVVAALAATLLFSAVVMGCLGLILLAVVWKLRRVKPPRGIMVFSLVVSALPLAAMALQLSLN